MKHSAKYVMKTGSCPEISAGRSQIGKQKNRVLRFMMQSILPILMVMTGTMGMISIPISAYAADFNMIEDVGVSAQNVAIGNIDGFSQSSAAVFENPAGLTRVKRVSMAAFSTTFMDAVYYNNVSMGVKTPIGYLGFGYYEASVFDIANTQRGGFGQPVTEFFDFQTSVMKFAYANMVNSRWSYGLGIDHYKTSFADVQGAGTDIEAGLTYTRPLYEISYVAKNMLPGEDVLFNNNRSEELGLRHVASGKIVLPSITLYGQFKQKNNLNFMSAGIAYRPLFLGFLEFRAGFRQYQVLNEVDHNLTLGVGVNVSGFQVDYAYERSEHVEFDHKSYFSASINF